MAGSISGLSSGLDTATIISQLMQLEAIPQSRIKNRIGSEQLQVNSMQTLNARIAGLFTKAEALAKADAWSPLTATSTNAKVTVATTGAAGPGSFALSVENTALTHRLEFAGTTGLTAPATVPTTVRVDRIDAAGQPGDPADILDLTTDGTLQGLVTAINDPENNTGLRATAVKVGTDQYRLLVESTATGTASDFTLTSAADGGDLLGGTAVRAGLDARITLGTSIVVESATNTFTDLVPGVSVTLAPDATGTGDVAVTRDTGKITSDVKALVDSINAALAEIDSLTAYNPATKASGMLAGDAGVRSVRGQLLDSIYPGDGTSLAGIGIQVDRTGKLVFDEAKFKEAYAADPAGVAAKFTTGTADGFAARVQTVADAASNKVDGTLTTAITGRNDGIERMQDSIEQWDIRLELRRTTLTRQFTALEVALDKMNSQSSWLAGQIGSLSNSSGS